MYSSTSYCKHVRNITNGVYMFMVQCLNGGDHTGRFKNQGTEVRCVPYVYKKPWSEVQSGMDITGK